MSQPLTSRERIQRMFEGRDGSAGLEGPVRCDRPAFHGGLNALLYGQPESMWAEMARIIPDMKAQGGYIIGTDHSAPDSVSLDVYREFVARAKQLGRYD